MMPRRIFWALLPAVLSALAPCARALGTPNRSALDARVQSAPWNAEDVLPVTCVNGIVTTIVFPEGETVLNFVTGFSSAWEFAASGRNLFMKPREESAATNLTVVTDRRTWLFDVKTDWRVSKATYRLTLSCPEDEARRQREAEDTGRVHDLLGRPSFSERPLNRNYTMNFGRAPESREIAPLEAFDDGRFTVLRFAANADFPAVYRKVGDEETLLNSHVEGGRLVIHGVYRELVLRAGEAVAGLYNEAFAGGEDGAGDGETTVPGLVRELKKEGL